MEYAIVHDLPGRLRVRCANLRSRAEISLELNRWLAMHDGLLTATVSLRTGSLLVTYSRALSRDDMLAMLDDLRLFEVSTMTARETPAPTLPGRVVDACVGHAASSFVKSLLPRPVRQALGWWKMGKRLFGLARAMAGGDPAGFIFDLARLVLFVVCGKSLLLRLPIIAMEVCLEWHDPVENSHPPSTPGPLALLSTSCSTHEGGEEAPPLGLPLSPVPA